MDRLQANGAVASSNAFEISTTATCTALEEKDGTSDARTELGCTTKINARHQGETKAMDLLENRIFDQAKGTTGS